MTTEIFHMNNTQSKCFAVRILVAPQFALLVIILMLMQAIANRVLKTVLRASTLMRTPASA
jgi:hypothetical protein